MEDVMGERVLNECGVCFLGQLSITPSPNIGTGRNPLYLRLEEETSF